MQGMRLKKGDMIKVVAGKEKGKTGKVLKIVAEKNKVVVEKLNFVKRHQKADAKGKGGIVEKEAPIHASNVMLLCDKCNTAVRFQHKLSDDGKKVRVCSKCHETLNA
jgi:large subunit ribosomal protein L24